MVMQRVGLALVALSAAAGVLISDAPSVAATGPLSSVLLRPDEQPGYTATGTPSTDATPASIIQGFTNLNSKQEHSYLRSLTNDGFVTSLYQVMGGSGGVQGFTQVLLFKKASGAKHWARTQLQLVEDDQAGQPITPFSVPGVKGSYGMISVIGPGVVNVFWSDGRCELGSGLYLPSATGKTNRQVEQPVIIGIQSQRRRIASLCK